MATPDVTVRSLNVTLQNGLKNQFTVQVSDLNGAAIDTSSGFTASLSLMSQSASVKGTRIDIVPTVVGSANGLTKFQISASSMDTIPCSEAMPAELELSNDGFATWVVLGEGVLRAAQRLLA